jgi:hypothetical protein
MPKKIRKVVYVKMAQGPPNLKEQILIAKVNNDNIGL